MNAPVPVAAEKLKAVAARLDDIDAEIAALNAKKREIYGAARKQGLDVRALKTALTLRRQDPKLFERQDAMVQAYLAAIDPSRARMRAGAQASAGAPVQASAPVQAHVHVHEGDPLQLVGEIGSRLEDLIFEHVDPAEVAEQLRLDGRQVISGTRASVIAEWFAGLSAALGQPVTEARP